MQIFQPTQSHSWKLIPILMQNTSPNFEPSGKNILNKNETQNILHVAHAQWLKIINTLVDISTFLLFPAKSMLTDSEHGQF